MQAKKQTYSTARLISASSIEVREGTEGPKHDPYSYTEWALTRGADIWLVHDGLGTWVKLNGELVGGEVDEALKATGCPLSLQGIKRCYARIKAAPIKAHRSHGGMRESEGMPGETLLVCKCGAVLDCDFNINAII